MAIVLQHRTVWVVLIAMMVSALVVDRGLVRRFLPVLVVGALLSGVLGIAIFGSKINDQFQTSATDEGTFLWRVQGWMALLETDEQTPLTYAVGLPAGTKFAQNETLATAAGHSMYISALLHVGVLGLCVFLAIVWRPIVKFYGLRRMEGIQAFPGPVFWVIFLISILFFGFTYSIGWDQAALIGIANSIVITRSCEKVNGQEQFVGSLESSMRDAGRKKVQEA
jgi:O-antigen ligase